MIVKYLGRIYERSSAVRGADYVHMLDAQGRIIDMFHGVDDLSNFVVLEGEFSEPTKTYDRYVAVIGDQCHKKLGEAAHWTLDTFKYLQALVDTRVDLNNELYRPGAVHVTSNMTDPSEYLYGEWRIVDKQLGCAKYLDTDTPDLFMPAECVDAYSANVVTHEHFVSVQLDISLNSTVSNAELGMLNTLKCGISAFAQKGVSICSPQVLATIDPLDGTVSCHGNASGTLQIQFTLPVMQDDMLDSYCTKFFWERSSALVMGIDRVGYATLGY